MKKIFLPLLILLLGTFIHVQAQTTWYNQAQARIDTLRKGPFTIHITNASGQAVSDSVRIRLKKHAFPWGTAYDLSYGSSSVGTTNSGSTSSAITSRYGDAEVYKTERWGKYVAYQLPVVSGKTYALTLRLAEIYFSKPASRIYDVYIDGKLYIKGIDKYSLSKGKYIAYDTTVQCTAINNILKVECMATTDNASINGLVLTETGGSSVLRLNCGGATVSIKGKTFYADASYLDANSGKLISTTDDWYKAVMLKYCNYGVCGNQFKWSGIEPTKGVLNYAPFENTMNWFRKNGMEMRAHTLLWGGNDNVDYHCVPQWVMNLSSTPKVMYDTCRMRVIREVTRYKGVVKEYDVLNEPSHANYLQSIVGDSINWNCFKWAHEADPDARLFVNDYNIIEWGDQTTNFCNLVKKMLDHGAPVTGIGTQCHIGSSVDLTNYKTRLDQLAQFGLPLKVTEFDMGAKSLTEQQYAAEIGKMMRLCFSHPAVEGFVFWGLTEPTWVPKSIVNLIREDQTTKIAADTLYDLLHKTWTTNTTVTADASGNATFKGYYGDYEVLVKNGSEWERFDISCPKSQKGKQFNLVLGTGASPRPQLLGVSVTGERTIQLLFDRKMKTPSAQLSQFKMFGSRMNYITDASLKEGDSTCVLLTTNGPISSRDYAPLSYAPGTWTDADGTAMEAFGPLLASNLAPSFLSSKTSTDGKTLLLTYDRNLVESTVRASEYIVTRNGENDTILMAKRGSATNTIELSLGKQITDTTDIVTVSYLGSSLQTTDGKYAATFDPVRAANALALPGLVSAITTMNGQYITLKFNMVMADPAGQESAFTLSCTSQPPRQVSGVVLNSYDKTQMRLALSSPVFKGDTVSLSYLPGALSASTGVPSKAFKYAVSNVSIATETEATNQDGVRCFPNPFSDNLTIANTGAFTSATIVDLLGRKRQQQSVEAGSIVVLPTSKLEAGSYLLILSNGENRTVLRIDKKD